MLPLCRAEGIGVTPYSPLASGRLTRDWSSESTLRSETDQIAKTKYDATAETDRQVVERVAEIAEKHAVPRVHIALAWLLQKQPITAPIIGATKISHLEDAVGALSWCLGHVGVAIPKGVARRREARLDALRRDARSPEPDLPRRGARDAAALPRRKDRGDPV